MLYEQNLHRRSIPASTSQSDIGQSVPSSLMWRAERCCAPNDVDHSSLLACLLRKVTDARDVEKLINLFIYLSFLLI